MKEYGYIFSTLPQYFNSMASFFFSCGNICEQCDIFFVFRFGVKEETKK